MVKMLYVVSILCLMGASLLFGLCGVQWMQGAPPDERDPWVPVAERLRVRQDLNDNGKAASSPLLEEAEALARYLDPPKPPAPRKEASLPTVSPASVSAPVPRPPSPTPQFRILAISYYRSNPERSLAMVWDATKGGYWIKKGDRLGHFVVERIEKEAILYRDGDQLRQMAVAVKQPAQLARPVGAKHASPVPASRQELAANQTVASASP